jgi:hypothetical protein
MSSPADDSSNLMHDGNKQPDSNGDPSSSSMSGYDLKGMLSKHNQQILSQYP